MKLKGQRNFYNELWIEIEKWSGTDRGNNSSSDIECLVVNITADKGNRATVGGG